MGNGQISIDKFAVSASELSRNVSSPKTFDKLAKKKSFTEKQTRTWTVLNEATQEYINDCVDSSVKFILNKATHEGHEIDGIQEILTETVDQIRGMLKTLKAPRNTYGNVKKISKQQRLASEESRIYHGHEETLEEVLREEEKLVIQCEKELKKLQQSRDDKVQLHPFLTNFKPELDIPSVT